MKRLYLFHTIFFLFFISTPQIFGKEISMGVNVGYWGAPGGSLEVSLLDLNKKFPLGFILGGGYFFQSSPGNAEEARRIFINDNTGGVIQKEGTIYIAYFDITYPVYKSDGFAFRFLAGPRYVKHIAHFAFLGDNEIFDIISTPFGLGAGIRFDFDIAKNLLLKFNTGYDFFEKTQLGGHGQFYYDPDSVDDNPRLNYTYADADNAINQPDHYLKMLLGIEYRF